MRDGAVRRQHHYYVLEQLEHLQSHCCRNPRLGDDSPPVANCSRRGTMRSSNARRCWWQHVLPIAEGRTTADVELLQKPSFRGLNHPTVSPPVANCSRRELAGSNHETILMVRPTFWITPIAQTSCQLVGSPRFSPGVEE